MGDRIRWGSRRHVASPCDEQDEDGNTVRTWDVMRNDECVEAGIRTRREARAAAKLLNENEGIS